MRGKIGGRGDGGRGNGGRGNGGRENGGRGAVGFIVAVDHS